MVERGGIGGGACGGGMKPGMAVTVGIGVVGGKGGGGKGGGGGALIAGVCSCPVISMGDHGGGSLYGNVGCVCG